MDNLKNQAISSVKWNAISQFTKLGIYFLTSILLARLLQPDDFGLLGMATAFTSLVAVFNDFGLGSAVVQKDNLDHKTLSSIFWVSLIIGMLAMGLTILSAPWIETFYRQEKLKLLLYILSTSFLLTSLGQVQLSLLVKKIDFKKIAIIESLSVLLGSLIAVVMAILNQGIWSLAAQIVVTSGIATFLLWLTSYWHPGFTFSFVNLRGVLSYSSGLFGFNLLNYFSRNADYLLIGKFLGAGPLGQYTFAYRLMQFPMQNIAGVVNRVLFPTLAQVKNNDEQFKLGYIHASRMIATVIFPLLIGVICLAPEFIIVVFGDKWAPAIPVIQVLAVVGVVQSIAGMVGNIYTAKGRTDWFLYWGIFSSIIIISGIVFGLRWGILGVAIGYACAILLILYPNFAIPFRLINLKLSNYFWSLKTQIGLAVLLSLVIFLSASLQRLSGISQVVILFSNIILGGCVYIYGIYKFDRATMTELLGVILGNSITRFQSYLDL